MSLLMDALKRAEKARQAEAERAKEEGADDPEKTELSLDPMDDDPARGGARRDDAPEPARPARDETEDSLELTPDEVRREIEAMEESLEDHLPAPGTGGEGATEPSGQDERDASSARLSLSLDYGDIPLDDTESTLPSMKSAQRSVQDYFDGTHSMSLSMDDVRGAIEREREEAAGGEPPADEGNTTIDGDTSPRERARAVLGAQAAAPSRGGRAAAAAAVLLIVVGGLAGGAWLFRDQLTAVFLGERQTVVARRPPPPAAPEPAAQPAPPPATGSAAAAEERESLLAAAQAARAEERALEEARAAAAAQAARDAEEAARTLAGAAPLAAPPAQAPQAGAAPAQTGAAPAPAREPQQAAAAQPEPVARVPLAEVLRASGGAAAPPDASLPGLRISRSRVPDRTHRALVQAYEAFSRGNDGAAMQAYQSVLARQPTNRDALLGAAAVHMRARAYEQAAGYYLEVLRRNPRDPVAQAALIALQEDLDPVSGESHVKNLIARHPDDGNLRFSLGNLYAEQGRWPEAQAAYFEALRLDPESPDYAFNLAVSLDRLGQGKAALNWYRRARELAAARPASFDDAGAARRIAMLTSP